MGRPTAAAARGQHPDHLGKHGKYARCRDAHSRVQSAARARPLTGGDAASGDGGGILGAGAAPGARPTVEAAEDGGEGAGEPAERIGERLHGQQRAA